MGKGQKQGKALARSLQRFLIFLMVLFFASWFEPFSTCQAQQDNAFTKLGRGLMNMGMGWGEVFLSLRKRMDEKGFWIGLPAGAAEGVYRSLIRAGVGAYEFLTFPCPWPKDYTPLLQPEFPWIDEG